MLSSLTAPTARFLVCPASFGYHSATYYNGVVVPYGVMPDLDNNGCSGGDNMVTAASHHEFAEMMTDTGPGSGWFTNWNPGNEIGELRRVTGMIHPSRP